MNNETKYDEFAARMEHQFPLLFQDQYGGFAVGEGWWPIIEVLCHRIQNHIDSRNHYVQKFPDLGYAPVEQVIVRQIKEKFGGLRFYYDGGDEYIAGLVSMAESWADRSCEECGAPGKHRGGGWIRTLCDEHEAKRQQAIKDRSEIHP